MPRSAENGDSLPHPRMSAEAFYHRLHESSGEGSLWRVHTLVNSSV